MNIQVRSGLYWTHFDLSTSTMFIILFLLFGSWGRDQTQSFGNGRQELYKWAVAPVLVCLFCFNKGSHVTQDGFNSQSSGRYLSSATGGYQHTHKRFYFLDCPEQYQALKMMHWMLCEHYWFWGRQSFLLWDCFYLIWRAIVGYSMSHCWKTQCREDEYLSCIHLGWL